MDLGIKDRVALVTGATNATGKAIARALARERARIVVSARTESRLREVAEDIRRETGAQIAAVPCDVTRSDSVRALADQALSRWGRIDIVVANLPGPPLGGYEASNLEQYERSMQASLLSVVRIAQEVTPHMRKAGWGRFIAISSIAAKQPLPGLVLANTLRPALAGLLKSMAMELAPHGVLCNVVAPGFVKTRRIEDMVSEQAERQGRTAAEVWEEITAEIPMGRLGSAEEVADVVAFLASERAAYLSGVTLPVDGGFVKSLT